MKFTYGELVAIFDGLCKLPDDAVIKYKDGQFEFDPVSIRDLKDKVLKEVKAFELANEALRVK